MISESPSIENGAVFKSLKELKLAVRKFALNINIETHTVKSEASRYIIQCKDEHCSWRLRANPIEGGFWKIKELAASHECIGIHGASNTSANKAFVANEIVELLRSQPEMTPVNIMNEIQRTHRIQISYKVAWEARELARTIIDGTHEESYAGMPAYCEQLFEANPGSFITLERAATNQFHRLFLCYYASAKGFASCKPLLGVDGTHLRSHYQGILLTATATDAEGQLFPVAFGVVNIEDKENWIWFLEQLRTALIEHVPDILERENALIILSDRAKGLLKGVPAIFPLAAHGYCLKHLEKNLKSTYKNPTLVTLLWKMAAAKTPSEFDELLLKFQEINPKAAEWLLGEADPQYWVDCYFPGRRYGHYTSNIAESLNSWLLTAREKPLRPMVETIRTKLMDWFERRREEGAKMQVNGFVSKVTKQLRKIMDQSQGYLVHHAIDTIYEVHSRQTGKDYVVNLAKRTCTCFGFQATGLPCFHAARTIIFAKGNVNDYVDKWFTVVEYRETYKNGILPPTAALDVDALPVFDMASEDIDSPVLSPALELDDDIQYDSDDNSDTMLPPDTRRPVGRPKKRRIRHQLEDERQKILCCSRCGGENHNRRTCKEPVKYQGRHEHA